MVLDPNVEFEETPEPKAPAPDPEREALKAEVGDLRSQMEGLAGLRNDAALIHKLKEVFGGDATDPRDALLRKEIKRLVPELDDVDKVKELLPQIVDVLAASAEDRLQEKTVSAQEVMKGFMSEIGLDPKDKDASSYLEEVLSHEIRVNPELMRAWARGNIKMAVTKAFEKVQSKLVAPIRAKAKVSAVRIISEVPKAAPKGGAPTPSSKEGGKVDFKDTSRANVQKIHDAAWDRLQALMEE
mgnify:CR=1 FL=1